MLEIGSRKAEGLEGGALGGEGGFLNGAWGRRRGTVVDLLATVLFFVIVSENILEILYAENVGESNFFRLGGVVSDFDPVASGDIDVVFEEAFVKALFCFAAGSVR